MKVEIQVLVSARYLWEVLSNYQATTGREVRASTRVVSASSSCIRIRQFRRRKKARPRLLDHISARHRKDRACWCSRQVQSVLQTLAAIAKQIYDCAVLLISCRMCGKYVGQKKKSKLSARKVASEQGMRTAMRKEGVRAMQE